MKWTNVRTAKLVCQLVMVPPMCGAQDVLVVPNGAPPAIDGHLDSGEWAGSAVSRLSDGSDVLLRHDGRFLYLGVRAGKDGFVSVCVSRGDTVRVLHASAALGAAVYTRTDTAWLLRTPFEWAMRARQMNADTRERQREYLATARWLGSTFDLSKTEKEIQIDLAFFEDGEPRIALGYYIANDGPVLPWPAALKDACPDHKVVSGFLPQTARFEPQNWVRVHLDS